MNCVNGQWMCMQSLKLTSTLKANLWRKILSQSDWMTNTVCSHKSNKWSTQTICCNRDSKIIHAKLSISTDSSSATMDPWTSLPELQPSSVQYVLQTVTFLLLLTPSTQLLPPNCDMHVRAKKMSCGSALDELVSMVTPRTVSPGSGGRSKMERDSGNG